MFWSPVDLKCWGDGDVFLGGTSQYWSLGGLEKALYKIIPQGIIMSGWSFKCEKMAPRTCWVTILHEIEPLLFRPARLWPFQGEPLQKKNWAHNILNTFSAFNLYAILNWSELNCLAGCYQSCIFQTLHDDNLFWASPHDTNVADHCLQNHNSVKR